MLSTAFTKLVGCTAPIQQAGMGGAATPALAAAVADAGALGMVNLVMVPADQVAAALEAAVAAEPLRERRWAQLMLALYRCGRQADALAAYQRMRRLLGVELGLDPSEQLAGLERAILGHDAALDVPRPPAVSVAPGGRTGSPPDMISSLIGRDQEAREVRKLLGERRLATVTGV
jgi:hypothetical protein